MGNQNVNEEYMIQEFWNKANETRCQSLNVFVSSTFADLKDEREGVKKAIEMCGCHAVLAETAEMRPGLSVLDQIQYWLRDIQMLVLIVAERYGQIGPTNVSWTEEEVRKAASIGSLAIYPYFMHIELPPGIEFDSEKRNRLVAFKEYLKCLPGTCSSLATPPQYTSGVSDLQLRVARDLSAYQSDCRVDKVLHRMTALWKERIENELRVQEESEQDSYNDSHLG